MTKPKIVCSHPVLVLPSHILPILCYQPQLLLFFTLNSSLHSIKFEKRKYSFSYSMFAVLFRCNGSFGIIHIQPEELPIALLVV